MPEGVDPDLRLQTGQAKTAPGELAPPITADAKVIRHTAGQCLKRVDLGRRLRLLGVRVGKLARADSEQAPAPGFIAAPVTSGHKTAEPGGADGTLDLFQDYSGGWPG